MRTTHMSIWSAAMVAVPLLGGAAHGAIFNDAAAGNWNAGATWGGATAPTAATDVINIDQYEVSIPTDPSNTTVTYFTGGEIHLSGTGALRSLDGYGTASQPLNLYMAGGTFYPYTVSWFGGTAQTLDLAAGYVSKISIAGSGTGSIGSSGAPTIMSGSGTLQKTGTGVLRISSYTTLNTFTGTFDVQTGTLELAKHQTNPSNLIANANINLSGGILKFLAPGFAVKNLTGTGSWTHLTAGYGNDLHVQPGGLVSPGTSGINGAPGTISRMPTGTGAAASLDLILNKDATSGNSRLEMDIFGASQANADQISWLDATGTSLVDFADANLIVRLYTPTANLATTSWTLITADGFGDGTTASISTRSNIVFNNITFQNLDGSAINAGWQNLAISYDRTAENNRVILTGNFVVPEPAGLALAVGGLALLARRRARVR